MGVRCMPFTTWKITIIDYKGAKYPHKCIGLSGKRKDGFYVFCFGYK